MSDKTAYAMTTVAQPGEIAGCIENVIGSAIEQAIKYERERIEGKKKPRNKPGAEGYRKILESDLAARGWTIAPKGAD